LLQALDRAAGLIAELAGGEAISKLYETYPTPFLPRTIATSVSKIQQRLGIPVSKSQAEGILSRLGYQPQPNTQNEQDTLAVTIPSHRLDVSWPEDIMEDLAQLIGYDKIPVLYPSAQLQALPRSQNLEWLENSRNASAACGLMEVLTYSFVDPDLVARFSSSSLPPATIGLKNPISKEISVMRPSLLPGLFQTLVYNFRRGQDSAAIFECGNIFLKDSKGHQEVPAISILLAGPRIGLHWSHGKKSAAYDFYDLRGRLECILKALKIHAPLQYLPLESAPFAHPVIYYALQIGDHKVGICGQISSQLAQDFKIKDDIFFFELRLPELMRCQSSLKIQSLPKFPGIERDLALELPQGVPAQQVLDAIGRTAPQLITQVLPFDVYQGENLPAGFRSLAIRIRFQSHERTLREVEIDDIMAAILSEIQQKFEAKQR
jgi:phenylalanyl-tRNA synthetase beta chain